MWGILLMGSGIFLWLIFSRWIDHRLEVQWKAMSRREPKMMRVSLRKRKMWVVGWFQMNQIRYNLPRYLLFLVGQMVPALWLLVWLTPLSTALWQSNYYIFDYYHLIYKENHLLNRYAEKVAKWTLFSLWDYLIHNRLKQSEKELCIWWTNPMSLRWLNLFFYDIDHQ